MKSIEQILAENGYECDWHHIVPGLALVPLTFERAKEAAPSMLTPVSVHASQAGEWLATLRLEDLLAMIPPDYGKDDTP